MKHSLSKALCSLIIFIIFPSPDVFARTFKTLGGVPIEGEILTVKTLRGKKIAILQLDKTYKVYKFPLERLSKEDQEYIKNKLSPSQNGPGAIGVTNPAASITSSQSGAPILPYYFSNSSGQHVSVKGRSVSAYNLKLEPDYYILYFGSAKSREFKEFTPKLIKFYKSYHSPTKPIIEIIFVSGDHNKITMENHMMYSNMPWPAIRFEDLEKTSGLYPHNVNPNTPALALTNRYGLPLIVPTSQPITDLSSHLSSSLNKIKIFLIKASKERNGRK